MCVCVCPWGCLSVEVFTRQARDRASSAHKRTSQGADPMQQPEPTANDSGESSSSASAVVARKPDLPVHLLWDDLNPVPVTDVKKRKPKKAGWGLKFQAEEGASDASRGVSSITLSNLPGYHAVAAAAQAKSLQQHNGEDDNIMMQRVEEVWEPEEIKEDAAMEEASDDDESLPGRPPRNASGRRSRRVLADDDDE